VSYKNFLAFPPTPRPVSDSNTFFQRERFDSIFLKRHFPISADEKATVDTIVFISVASRTAAPLYSQQ
jgi:hypothetical protein